MSADHNAICYGQSQSSKQVLRLEPAPTTITSDLTWGLEYNPPRQAWSKNSHTFCPPLTSPIVDNSISQIKVSYFMHNHSLYRSSLSDLKSVAIRLRYSSFIGVIAHAITLLHHPIPCRPLESLDPEHL
jgi:hypothetical protein